MVEELPLERIRELCDPTVLGCQSSEDVKPLDTIVGQERAVKSLHFGLEIKHLGFNIYVAGLPGTGRTTAVKRFLEDIAKEKPVPDDWCYVNNFDDSYGPNVLHVPAGRGKEFQADMKSLVEGAEREIRRVFESEEYAARRQQTVKTYQKKREEIFEQINQQAQKAGFVIKASQIGLLTIPIKDGRPISDEEFQSLEPEERETFTKKREELQEELKASFRQARTIERQIATEIEELDRRVAIFVLDPLIEELKDKHEGLPEVLAYLANVRDDIVENLSQFRSEPQEQVTVPFMPPGGPKEQFMRRYDVNVVVDNSELKGAPVMTEMNPTYNNLFGRIEKEAQFGALVTDFTMIRGGSLHKANGGYLVLHVEDVLRNLFSWDSLKRALRNKEIIIEEAGERLGFITTKSVRPEPVPLSTKVVLIGQPFIYYLLNAYDEDFSELFKVKADFDTRMDRTEDNIQDYASFVCTICEEEGHPHLDSTALAKLVEHGSRLAEDQRKLSTRFGEISDIIREACFYATQENAMSVNGAHVTRAIEEKFYRSSLMQERIVEMIDRGLLMVNVTGESVGVVNGLSVIDLGDITFGRPNRITASVSVGREGLVDIEREAKLGGPIHTKGMLILAGYMAEKYAQDKPLSLSARLVFEQSYSGIEGDSASSTELYALLSSLSGVPIKQGIAVTGSVNQKGEVQPIGGVNEKIEGFFEVCRTNGLTGSQGVVIPAANVESLMLKEDVVRTVAEGKFHIWAVRTIDDGIEVLTGVPAGARRDDGTYDKDTINYLVDERLHEMSETLKEFGGPGEEGKEQFEGEDEESQEGGEDGDDDPQ
jgi:lon-related putative ATP-dependent protease